MTDYSGWCVHGDISTNQKSSNKIELSGLSQDLFDFKCFDMTPSIIILPIHTPKSYTHPPNHTPIHSWGTLHSLQIFKQTQIISRFIAFLVI